MREATQQEIEQLGNWFKGFEIAKWLSEKSGIRPVTSFTINAGQEYNDEGYDMRVTELIINGTVILNGYPDEDSFENIDDYYKAEDDYCEQSRKYEISTSDYDYSSSSDPMYGVLMSLNDASLSWDQNNAPVKLMVAE